MYLDFFFLSKLATCAQVAERLIQIGPPTTNWKWRHLSYVSRTWIHETLWPLRNAMERRTQQETSASIHRYTTSLCKENHRRKHTFYGHRCDIKVCVCVCERLDMFVIRFLSMLNFITISLFSFFFSSAQSNSATMSGQFGDVFLTDKRKWSRRGRFKTRLSLCNRYHTVFDSNDIVQSSIYGVRTTNGNASSNYLLLADLSKGEFKVYLHKVSKKIIKTISPESKCVVVHRNQSRSE